MQVSELGIEGISVPRKAGCVLVDTSAVSKCEAMPT